MLKQSTAANVMVFMADSSDHITGKAGLTLTITASKDGAAFASISPTVTERGNGWYNVALTTAHTDTLGDLAVHVTGSGADPSDFLNRVIAVDLADSVRAGLTSLPNAAASANGGLPILSSSGTTLAYTVSTVTTLTNLPAITTDWLTGTGVAASAVTKIQAGLATPTNITAATGIVLASGTHTGAVIPTVTNLTNAPTAGDFTATMKTSIGTAVAASAVASVTGNVGGNVVGSVGSVTGAVVLPSIPNDWITGAGLAADAVTEIQSGLSTLTAAGVRTAVGMASADLDTQLDAILSAASSGGLDAAGVRAALGMSSANLDSQLGSIATNVSTILVTTGNYLDVAVSSRLAPTVAGRTLDVTATGEAGIDWANIGSPTTAVALSATTISTGQTIAAVSGAVGSVTANVALPSIPAGWITAAGIATDAIGASELADSATAAIADRVLVRNLMGGLDGGRTVQQALFFLRNRWENPGGLLTVYETDDATESWTSVTTTTDSDPVTSSNPT